MRYPLDNWDVLRNGYTFGVKTSYSSFHLGVDKVVPVGTDVHAPTDGEIVRQYKGTEGGNTLEFRDQFGVVWRFMHLQLFEGPIGQVKEGQVIAATGNTGTLTTGPHLHTDVWPGGAVLINDHTKCVDPDAYVKDHLMSAAQKYDNFIIRKKNGQGAGSYAYVARGSKEIITKDLAGLALITFLDRLPSGTYPQECIVGVDELVWNQIPDTSAFF